MSNIKEIDFKINKDLKEGKGYIILSTEEDIMYRGKNFKANNFDNDLGVLSYCGMPFYRVDNKSKLKKDHYFVSDDGHYTFSRHNDGETVNIRYIEKEEKEKPRYIFGVGELKFSNEDYNKRLNTLFKEDKEEKEKTLKMGECPNFSKIVDDIINEYIENHGKYLSVPRAELNITTPDAESFKKKLEEAITVKEKDEDLMIYNFGYNKRLIYSFKTFELTCETPKKEFYDRLLKFNGTSYDKLFKKEIVEKHEGSFIGIGSGGMGNIIDKIDDFEDYIKFIDFGYNGIDFTFENYLFWKY